MASDLSLVPWTARRGEVLRLEVHESQRQYLGTPTFAGFLADDEAHPTFASFAVCDGETVIGMVCFGHELDHSADRSWIPLLVVDRRYQGMGYGRRLLSKAIAAIREDVPGCRAIGLN
jgi:diamine N-acetyltransferase